MQKAVFKTTRILGDLGFMTEKELSKLIYEKKNVIIYGAGMVGSLVLLRMKALELDNSVVGFVVTKATNNQYYMGYRVYSIDEYDDAKNCLIIVATMSKNHGQILQELKKRNLDNFLIVDEELYSDMEKGYILDYLHTPKNNIEGDIDVLMMSSDNNTTSGAFLCMVDLCRGMMDKKIKTLVVLPGYGNAEQMLRDSCIKYTFVQSRSGLVAIDEEGDEPSMNSVAVGKIERLIKKHHIKLIHLNSSHTYVGALAARNTGRPYIWHIRENIKEQRLKFIDEVQKYSLINEAAEIVTVSDYVGSCYPKLSQDKVVCIYDGVDTKKYYYEHVIMSGETIRILMPGIMVPLKGQHQLIKAAYGLKKSGMKFDISLVGSGDADYIKMIEEMIDQFDLNDMVHLYGRINNLEDWYRNTDIVVVCSRSEAFGRVTVEAQLAGCIVIGADCGATPELIHDGITGYLYELDDVEMLTAQIIKACRNKDKTLIIARRGQRQALEKFDKSLNCDNVLKEYKRILGDKICG